MSESIALAVINELGGIIAALGVILLGYWRFADRKKVDIASHDARVAAKAVVETAETVKRTMDTTVKTIEDTKHIVEEVREATDGRLSGIEKKLEDRDEELKKALQDNSTLLLQVQKMTRGGSDRRRDGDPV